MIANVPEPKVAQNHFDDIKILDERNNFHRALTVRNIFELTKHKNE